MNVDQLLRIVTNLPGHLPVVVEDSTAGWMQGTRLYVVPAHFDCLEITEPPMWPPTVDVEVDVAKTKDPGGRSGISAPPALRRATNHARTAGDSR